VRDYNFFSPYAAQPERKNYTNFIAGIIVILFALILIIYEFNLIFENKRLNSEIIDLDTKLQSEEMATDLSRVNQKTDSLASMESQYNLIQELYLNLKQRDTVNPELMDKIASVRPQYLFLMNLNMNPIEITINGYASETKPIAQYLYNLKQIQEFNDVVIQEISLENEHYYFTIIAGGFDEN